MEDALAVACRCPVESVVAGRTDAGVHARGQVFSCEIPDASDLDRLRAAVNAMTPPSVVLLELEACSEDFSARFSATSRTYVYRLNGAPTPDPFMRLYEWWVKVPLDHERMHAAARCLLGEHDFAAFCKVGSAGGTTRRVLDVDVRDVGGMRVEVRMTASSFCHQMVRSVIGLLTRVGHLRSEVEDVSRVLDSADRTANTSVAPPHGLTLWSVGYGPIDP